MDRQSTGTCAGLISATVQVKRALSGQGESKCPHQAKARASNCGNAPTRFANLAVERGTALPT